MKTVTDQSFGVIPVWKNYEGSVFFCLVQQGGGYWGFPKGHPNENETEEVSARRELAEETGIKNIEFFGEPLSQAYTFQMNSTVYDKTVVYFIGVVLGTDSSTPDEFKSEISDMKWLQYKEARDLITYDSTKLLLDEAFERIKNN